MIRFFLQLAVALTAILSADAVFAHAKTDSITLKNGNNITGEIKELLSGILKLSTDSMGTVAIEWEDVVAVESDYRYEVRSNDGSRFYGTVIMDIAGILTVHHYGGTRELAPLDIVELRPVANDFKDRIDIYLATGAAFNKASDISTLEFNTTIVYEDEDSRNQFTGRSTNTNTAGDLKQSSKVDLSRRVWTDRTQLYRTLHANYEKNDELALDYRITTGIGWGRYFSDTNRHRFATEVGVQALTERSTSGNETQSVEGFINADYRLWKFNTPELDLALSGSVYPSLTESGRVRGASDVRLRWEIVADLFFDFTIWGTYDNQNEGESSLDYGLTTGLGWKY